MAQLLEHCTTNLQAVCSNPAHTYVYGMFPTESPHPHICQVQPTNQYTKRPQNYIIEYHVLLFCRQAVRRNESWDSLRTQADLDSNSNLRGLWH